MPFGILLICDDAVKGPSVVASHFGDSGKSGPSQATIRRLVNQHTQTGSGEPAPEVLLRVDEGRFFSVIVGETGGEKQYFLAFALGEREPLESVLVDLDQKRAAVAHSVQQGTVESVLKALYQKNLELDKKLTDPETIKEIIIRRTNKLLDAGDFARAQELIGLAEKVPQKLAVTVRAADVAYQQKNFKAAEKAYRQAAELAEEVGERDLEQALAMKAQKAKQVPGLLKEQRSVVQGIEKTVGGLAKRVEAVYRFILEGVGQAIRVSDKLEDDDTLRVLRRLEEVVSEANELSRKLDELDEEIRALVAEALDKVSG
ncbi:MAG: hypothetical protein Kow0069_17790 [Promethearchaeota archaeon]